MHRRKQKLIIAVMIMICAGLFQTSAETKNSFLFYLNFGNIWNYLYINTFIKKEKKKRQDLT